MSNSFKGYSLFEDVEDLELRAFNRGKVMANLYEDNSQGNNTSKQGTLLLVGYFNEVEASERKDALTQFQLEISNRGYVYAEA